jgi:hypothetical protein
MNRPKTGIAWILGILLVFSGVALGESGKADSRAAIGLQAQFGFMGNHTGVLALTGKFPVLPVMFALGYNLAAGPLVTIPGFGWTAGGTFTLSADWWLFHTPLLGVFSFYLGPGMGLLLGSSVDFVLRLPIGFQIFLLPPLEIFLELTPGVSVIPTPSFRFYSAIGLRFWI